MLKMHTSSAHCSTVSLYSIQSYFFSQIFFHSISCTICFFIFLNYCSVYQYLILLDPFYSFLFSTPITLHSAIKSLRLSFMLSEVNTTESNLTFAKFSPIFYQPENSLSIPAVLIKWLSLFLNQLFATLIPFLWHKLKNPPFFNSFSKLITFRHLFITYPVILQ